MKCVARCVTITPSRPVALAGYATRSTLSVGVESDLEANILLVFDDSGEAVLALIQLDCLFASRLFKERLHAALLDRSWAIDFEALVLVASHTHFAPALDDAKPKLGTLDPAYFEDTCQSLAGAMVEMAAATREEVVCEYFAASCPLAVCRRVLRLSLSWSPPFFRRRMRMGPDFTRRVDDRMQAVLLRGADSGSPVALLWRWSCHPVGQTNKRMVSSDFPGVVRNAIRREFSVDALPVLFLPGFAGDLRPRLPFPGRVASRFRGFGAMSRSRYMNWCLELSSQVLSMLSRPAERSFKLESLSLATADFTIAELGLQGRVPDVPLKLVRINDLVDLVLIGAEVLQGYSTLISEHLRNSQSAPMTVLVGYYDQCFGYLPTDFDISLGGYEVDGFLEYFDLKGRFAARIEEQVLKSIGILVGNAMKKERPEKGES